jgi:hypothetical protein
VAERIPQSVAYLVVFRAYLSADGKTPATGKTIAMTVSKNGAAFGNPNAGATNATEIASGFYKFTLDTTDTGTAGPLAWRGTHADINDAGDVLTVANAHNAGFDGVPNAAAGANGGVPVLSVGATTLGYTLATVTTYTGNTPQTGDSFARIGAAGVGLTSVGLAANQDVRNVLGTLTATERQAIANEVEAQIIDETDSEKVLTAITDKIASVNPSLSGLTISAIASAVRDVSNASPAANSLGAGVNAIYTKVVNLPASPAAVGSAMTVSDKTGFSLTSAYDFAKGTVAMTEGYAADGAAPTPVQALFMMISYLFERSVAGVTVTAKKLDGTTTAMTFTLDDGTTPTTQTRAS